MLRYMAMTLCFSFLSFAFGQQSEPRNFSIAESFTVSAGTVEVVVTDKAGERVTNLDQDAFKLYVDGLAMDLTYFDEIQPEIIEKGVAPGRNFLVFIDDWFTIRKYRARLFDKLLDEVHGLQQGDRMAVVRFRGEGLELLSDYTSDKEALFDTIEKAAAMTPGDMIRRTRLEVRANVERNSAAIYQDGISAQARDDGQRPKSLEALYESHGVFVDETSTAQILKSKQGDNRNVSVDIMAEELIKQVDDTVRSVEMAMRGMVQKEGRNVMLLMSAGWPHNLRQALGLTTERTKKQGAGDWVLRPITDSANLLGFTIYPMLLSQLDQGIFTDATAPGFSDFSTVSEFTVQHEGLEFLAEQTGGRLVNKAHMQALPLGQVFDDTNAYYTLGFQLPEAAPGTRHGITVKVAGDYTVRHRKEFRNRTEDEKLALIAEAALLQGANDDLGVDLGQAQHKGRRKVVVPVRLRIPMDWVTLLPQNNDRFTADMKLAVASEDGSGNRSELVSEPIRLTGGKPGPNTVTTYEAQLMLRNKPQRLVFSISDAIGGGAITRTVDYRPL